MYVFNLIQEQKYVFRNVVDNRREKHGVFLVIDK